MSEKLYTSHCSVPGHGMSCANAYDIYPSKKALSKIRRRAAKKLIEHELSMMVDPQNAPTPGGWPADNAPKSHVWG